MTRIQRGFQTGRILGLNRNDFDLRHQLLDQHRHARCQTAAAHRDEYAVNMGILLQQLQRQRSLPGNHHRMVERRNPGEPLLLRQIDGFGFGFIEIRAVQQHFTAEAAHRINFDIRGGGWHDDERLHAQARCRESHALRFLFFRQTRHHRVRPAQLKAVHRLTVFTLHQHNVIEARRELFHFLQRRDLRGFVYRRAQYRSEVFRPLRGGGQGLRLGHH